MISRSRSTNLETLSLFFWSCVQPQKYPWLIVAIITACAAIFFRRLMCEITKSFWCTQVNWGKKCQPEHPGSGKDDEWPA